jgi:SAM-dependent methyltransferase
MNKPEVWHHGLVAREWGEFQTESGNELPYFQSIIQKSGQPALDLGCGSGRLLLPFLQAGLEVDGCDLSKDMLAQCRERAKTLGLSPQLYEQAMHELDLPRRYRTVYACGVIGLGGERQLTQRGMRLCYEHLRAGGTFAFDFSPRWNDPPAYLSKLPENRHSLPDEWPVSSERELLADGTELEISARTVAVDPLHETQVRQLRARLWRNDELLKEEKHTMRYEEYGMNELLLMLQQAGFADIRIFGDYSDEPATADHTGLVFVCKK